MARRERQPVALPQERHRGRVHAGRPASRERDDGGGRLKDLAEALLHAPVHVDEARVAVRDGRLRERGPHARVDLDGARQKEGVVLGVEGHRCPRWRSG